MVVVTDPLQPERPEDPLHPFPRDLNPQHPGDLREAHGDDRALGDRLGGKVDQPVVQRAAREFKDELGTPSARPVGPFGVHRPLEPVA